MAWLGARSDPALTKRVGEPEGRKDVVRKALAQIAEPRRHRVLEQFARLVGAGPGICPMLREALAHRSPRVRLVAAYLLGQWKDREAVPGLVELVEKDEGEAEFGYDWNTSTSSGWTCTVFQVARSAGKALTSILGYDPPAPGARGLSAKELRNWYATRWRAWLATHR